jgi:hypothetical protein
MSFTPSVVALNNSTLRRAGKPVTKVAPIAYSPWTLTRIPGVIALAALAVSGCGAGSDKRLSEAEFTQRADSICKGAEAKRATTDPFDLEKLAEQMLRNLRDMSPPSAIEPEFNAWVASLEDIRATAIAYVDASTTAERRAAGARASAAIQRGYKTQATFPLPGSCKS